MPTLNLEFTKVDRQRGTQGLDGTAFLSYYHAPYEWSFVWDGSSSIIEVGWGGYGEPVQFHVWAPEPGCTVAEFEAHVRKVIEANT